MFIIEFFLFSFHKTLSISNIICLQKFELISLRVTTVTDVILEWSEKEVVPKFWMWLEPMERCYSPQKTQAFCATDMCDTTITHYIQLQQEKRRNIFIKTFKCLGHYLQEPSLRLCIYSSIFFRFKSMWFFPIVMAITIPTKAQNTEIQR